jgi:hypothetical protein
LNRKDNLILTKTIAIVLLLLGTAAVCSARREEPLKQLMAKADAASAGEQADLCMQVAERELKLTIDSYKANKPEDGRVSLQQIVKYADKAHFAAMHSGKKLKPTEIKVRRIASHLRDLKFNVDADDQPLVQAAVDKLEDFRTEILKSMFGSNKNE